CPPSSGSSTGKACWWWPSTTPSWPWRGTCWPVFAGQFTLAPAAFSLLGAYTSGVLNFHYGISPAVGIPAGVVVAGLTGLLLGRIALLGGHRHHPQLVAGRAQGGNARDHRPQWGGQVHPAQDHLQLPAAQTGRRALERQVAVVG